MKAAKRFLVWTFLSLTIFGGTSIASVAHSTGAPVWAVGNYWQYAYTPSVEFATTLERITQSISYLVVGSIGLNNEESVLFTTIETPQGPIPQLYTTSGNEVWDGDLTPAVEVGFPLEVGQTWARQVVLDDRTLTLSASVLALEMVNVNAGTFQAYRIQYKEDDQSFAELWYSPFVGSFVKRINILAPSSAIFGGVDFPGIQVGTWNLEQAWRFPQDVAIDQMFETLERSAQSGHVDLTLTVLQWLLRNDIATTQARALQSELLQAK